MLPMRFLWILTACAGLAARAALAADVPEATFAVQLQRPSAAYPPDASIAIQVPARTWDELDNVQVHVAIDDQMPTVLPATLAEKNAKHVVVKVPIGDLNAASGQRVSLWLEGRTRASPPARTTSNQVCFFVGTTAQMYKALALMLATEARNVGQTWKQVQQHRVELQVLLHEDLADGDGPQLADDIQAFDKLFTDARKSRWQLESWLAFLEQTHEPAAALSKHLANVPDRMLKFETTAQPLLAQSVERLRKSMTPEGHRQALATADDALGQMDATLKESLKVLHRAGGYCEAIMLLQEIVQQTEEIRQDTEEEKRRRIQEILK